MVSTPGKPRGGCEFHFLRPSWRPTPFFKDWFGFEFDRKIREVSSRRRRRQEQLCRRVLLRHE